MLDATDFPHIECEWPNSKPAIEKIYADCNSCGLCREVCPEWAITQKYLEPRYFYEVHAEQCTGCGECLEYCPAPGALVQYEQ